jgi:NAD(P)-dependent dehydrogenase (short-subunit alcohol dehydrogenase family)
MDLQLSGKLALVTSSASGIGLAIGSALTDEGATVLISGRSENREAEAIAKIRRKHSHAKFGPCIGDLGKGEAIKHTTSKFPDVDIVVDHLGHYEVKAFEDISDETWMTIIETNSMSGERVRRHYLPKIKAWNGFFAQESMGRPIDM